MSEAKCAEKCRGCFFYGRSTGTCDYIFFMDQRRPCPPGAGCTVFMTEKEWKTQVMQPKWDSKLGYQMYLEGKTDEQIAQALGTTVGAVGWQRRKNWKNLAPAGGDRKASAAVNFGDCKPGKKRTGVKGSSTAGNVTGGAAAVRKEGNGLPRRCASSNNAEKREDTGGQDPDIRYKDRGSVMKLIEGAVEKKTGMDAVLTADAILCLWSWDSVDHLEAAKRSIELLIEKIGGGQ